MNFYSTSFREFYPQNKLNFKFSVYNYSSNDFKVGVSGTDYVYFHFFSGIIKDVSGDIVGTYNGSKVDIDGYINTGSLSYYINDKPIARDIQLKSDSYFGGVSVDILDSNYINLDSYVRGTTFPQINFSDFFTLNGISGKINHDGWFPVKVFSVSSSSITGTWEFPTIIRPFTTCNFYNNSVSGLAVGTTISLNLDTNFGKKTFLLKTQSEGNGGNAEEDPDDPVEKLENGYAELWKISGETFQPTQGDYIYELLYAAGSTSSVNLEFDYVNGKTGDLLLNRSYPATIIYSGNLPVKNGIASGYLSNSKPKTTDWIDLNTLNKDYIDFYPDFSSRYFEGLVATGTVSYNVSLSNLTYSLNDQIIAQPDFFVDLGGYTGTFSNPVSNLKQYSILTSYNGISTYTGPTYKTIYADVKESDKGQYTFTDVVATISGVLLGNEISSSNPNIPSTSLNIYPYRGIAFGSNDLYDTILVSGDPIGAETPFFYITQDQPTLFLKHVPNITYNGKIDLEAGSVISGAICLPNKSYQKRGSDIDLTTSSKTTNAFITSCISDSLNFFKNLHPLSGVQNPSTRISVVDDNQVIDFDKELNINSNIFLTSVSETFYSENSFESLDYIYPFKYVGHPKKVYLFDEKEFLYSPTRNFILDRDYEKTALSSLLPFNIVSEGEDQNCFYSVGLTKVTGEDSEINGFRTLKCTTNGSSPAYIKIPFIPNSTVGGTIDAYTVFQIKINDTFNGYIQIYCPQCSDDIKRVNFNAGSQPPDEDETGFRILKANFHFDDKPEIAYMYVAVVDAIDSTPLSPCTSVKTVHFRRAYLNYNNLPNSDKLTDVVTFGLELTIYAAFAYFINKIHNVKGNFGFYVAGATGGGGKHSNYYLSSIDDIPKYNGQFSAYAYSNYPNQYRQILFYIKSANDYTLEQITSDNPTTLGYKLFKFFEDKIWREDGYYLFVTQRAGNENFLGLEVGDNYVKIGEEIFLNTDATYGDAVTEIIRVINLFGLEPSTKIISYDDEGFKMFAKIPIQNGLDVTPLKNYEIQSIVFSGRLPKAKTLYIPAGFARYYPNNSSQETFGYFYETTDFFECHNDAVSADGSVTSFPGVKEELNSLAETTVNLQSIKNNNINLTRLVGVRPTKEIEVSKQVNYTVKLTSAYFNFLSDQVEPHTGLFINYKQRTSDVWSAWLADDPDMTQNVYELVFDPDDQSYVFNNIGINDNFEHTKFLKVRNTEPDFKFSGVSDSAKVSIKIEKDNQDVFVVEKFVP
jgi:hypothetical protein